MKNHEAVKVVHISESVHRLLKVAAAATGRRIRDVVEAAVTESIQGKVTEHTQERRE